MGGGKKKKKGGGGQKQNWNFECYLEKKHSCVIVAVVDRQC